ncbi:MAG: hypothetical protein LDL30_12085 [Desulfovibrio sp.]|nr:hypothetical protein [Desulfovibrio sp.]MCA1987315.1 hypothetical protein [Desulfovibrio sp.]
MLLFRLCFAFLAFAGAFVAAGLLCQALGAWIFLALPLLVAVCVVNGVV